GPARDGGAVPRASPWLPSRSTLRGLAGLLADDLVLVADPLALVGLGLADLPDVRGRLADELLVAATDDDGRRGRNLELDPGRVRDEDRVRVPHLDLQIRAPHDGAIADPHDRPALLEGRGAAGHHVRHQRAREAGCAAVELL